MLSIAGASHKSSPICANINTLFVYHVFSGLVPLLGLTGSGLGQPGSQQAKLIGHAKLFVSCGEILLAAVECLQLLCDELARDGEVG